MCPSPTRPGPRPGPSGKRLPEPMVATVLTNGPTDGPTDRSADGPAGWRQSRGRMRGLAVGVATFGLGGLVTAWLLVTDPVLLTAGALLVAGLVMFGRRLLAGGAQTAGPTVVSAEILAGSGRRAFTEGFWKGVWLGAALVSLLVSFLIVFSLAREALTFITRVDWADLWAIGWFPRRGLYDIRTLVVASLIVTVIAMVVAMPVGLGAAVYLSEYARPRVRAWLKPVLEILAGIPSVVVGFFALTFIAPEFIGRLFSGHDTGSLAAAGVGVGILTVPLVASVSEDAMRAVPRSLREASAGLGARRVTTSVRVVIPAAVSGLAAAFIVGVSRAIGETMVVFLAGGAGDTAIFTASPLHGSLTMTAGMASLASGTDNVVGQGLTFQSLYFVGLLLFLITMGLNVAAGRFVGRIRERY